MQFMKNHFSKKHSQVKDEQTASDFDSFLTALLEKEEMKVIRDGEILRITFRSLHFELPCSSRRQVRHAIASIRRNLQEEISQEEREGTAPSHCGLSLKADALAAWQNIWEQL